LLAGNPSRKRAPSRLPDPGTLTQLGTLQELRVIRDKDGEHEIHRFGGPSNRDGPPLFWSPKLRMLLVFPPKRPTKWKELGPLSREQADEILTVNDGMPAAKLFRRWSMHEPVAISKIKIRDYRLRPTGSMKHLVYRSDKFSPTRVTEDFIHEMPKTDRIAVAGAGSVPDAIAIWGPRLTVTERGLVY
jgi:hypothetical protein